MHETLSFFKPPYATTPLLFCTRDKNLNADISFRSLNLSTDLSLIHSWVTQPYAEKFWQLSVDRAELEDIYQSLLDSPLAHSFIGLLDQKIVCQIDLYHVSAEEIKEHVPAGPGNCGLHILLCPPHESRKGLATAMLKAFIQFYFSFADARTLYGEPDGANTAACLAAINAGFHYEKPIKLSYKTAHLYSITRKQFLQNVK